MNQCIYLDYAASTPVDQRVLNAMQPYFSEKFGNPGSLHSFGQEAIAAVDMARETVARHIGAEFRQILFTASATEANNLALRSVTATARRAGLKNPKIIISAIEHESVLEAARDLEKEGVEIVYLPVGADGVVNLEKLKGALDERTVLVSIMYANNEVGTVQPIKQAAKIIEEFRRAHRRSEDGIRSGHGARETRGTQKAQALPLFHTDAAQAFQFLSCAINGVGGAAGAANAADFDELGGADGLSGSSGLGVDLMTLSSHKIYGPKGAGALFVRDPKMLVPQIAGGGQEFGMRSGTENVPAIVGFAKAVELIAESRGAENKKITSLRKMLWQGIREIIPNTAVNGFGEDGGVGGEIGGGGGYNRGSAGRGRSEAEAGATRTLPNILNVYFPGHEAQDLLVKFDLAGLAVSSGSACRSRALQSSYVLEAMGYSKERAKSSIRFSVGRPTTKEEIVRATGIIRETFFRKLS